MTITVALTGSPVMNRLPVRLALFFLAYLACVFLDGVMPIRADRYAHFCLPSGLFCGVLLVHPTRSWPWFFGIALLSNLAFAFGQELPGGLILASAFADVLPIVAAAWGLRRVGIYCPDLSRTRDFLGFAMVCGLGATLIGATMGGAIVATMLGRSFWRVWILFWGSDILGLLLMAPLVLTWMRPAGGGRPSGFTSASPGFSSGVSKRKQPHRFFEFAVFVVVAVALSLLGLYLEIRLHTGFKFLALPAIIWGGMRFSPRALAAANLFLAIALALSLSLPLIPIVPAEIFHRALSWKIFVAVAVLFGWLLLSIFSERRRAMDELYRASERLQLIVTRAPLAMVVIDPAGLVTFWNPAAETLFGWKSAEILGQPAPRELGPACNSRIPQGIDEGLEKTVEGFDYATRRQDGAEIQVRIWSMPLHDPEGMPAGALRIFHDVTARVHAEVERDRLISELSRKNRELESIIYVSSHDLRSPMVNIQGFSQRLQLAVADLEYLALAEVVPTPLRSELVSLSKERIRPSLDFILKSVSKMDVLLAGLLRISRLGRAAMQIQQLDMNKLVADVIAAQMFEAQQCGASVIAGALPPCYGDATQIAQVMSNLLDNALKYRDPSRPLVIRVTGESQEGHTVYCVEDNGLGIPSGQLEKIWQVFHRVNPRGAVSGEGLGLAIVNRIVDRHHGKAWVESNPGTGSRFYVSLSASGPPSGPEQVLKL